jgi:hypothetical protein
MYTWVVLLNGHIYYEAMDYGDAVANCPPEGEVTELLTKDLHKYLETNVAAYF